MLASDECSSLRRILETANNIVDLTAGSSQRRQCCTFNSEISPLPLVPRPTPILEILVQDGVPSITAKKLSMLFDKVANQLYMDFESGFRKTWTKICAIPDSSSSSSLNALRLKLWTALAGLYRKKVDTWAEEIRKRASSYITDWGGHALKSKAPDDLNNDRGKFRQDFLPVLEAYFSKNRRPSKADKAFLAEKSGMSLRQIHVWFQNRRSRIRKSELHVDARKSVGGANVDDLSNSRCSSVLLLAEDAFSTCSPSYAFPTVYPPEISPDADPFPCRFGDNSCIARPCWFRKPSPCSFETTEPDVAALSLAFAQLHIDDSYPSMSENNETIMDGLQIVTKEHSCDVTSLYTVHPLRAPLTSLIRNVTSGVVLHCDKLSDCIKTPCKTIISDHGPRTNVTNPRRHQTGCSPPTAPSSLPSRGLPDEFASVPTNSPITLRTEETREANKSSKKTSSPQRTASSATSRKKGKKSQNARTVQVTKQSSEQPASYPSPSSSIVPLPALSYSSASSSSSTYSQSPTTSLMMLSDGLFPSINACQSCSSSLTLPESLSDEVPPPVFASDFSFEFLKSPLDYTFSQDLPTYPSYSDSFDSISQGLQSSPDFAPPSLIFG